MRFVHNIRAFYFRLFVSNLLIGYRSNEIFVLAHKKLAWVSMISVRRKQGAYDSVGAIRVHVLETPGNRNTRHRKHIVFSTLRKYTTTFGKNILDPYS